MKEKRWGVNSAGGWCGAEGVWSIGILMFLFVVSNCGLSCKMMLWPNEHHMC